MYVIIPIFVRDQESSYSDDEDDDYKLSECKVRDAIFFTISTLTDYFEDGKTYAAIYSGTNVFNSPLTKEAIAEKIMQQSLFNANYMKLLIKPLSINECFKGRRFKTPEYKVYEKALLLMLPKLSVPSGKLKVEYTFGFSNAASDLDNPVKAFTDVLQKKYGFNDKYIYELSIKKVLVKKGQEFVEFEISPLDE